MPQQSVTSHPSWSPTPHPPTVGYLFLVLASLCQASARAVTFADAFACCSYGSSVVDGKGRDVPRPSGTLVLFSLQVDHGSEGGLDVALPFRLPIWTCNQRCVCVVGSGSPNLSNVFLGLCA